MATHVERRNQSDIRPRLRSGSVGRGGAGRGLTERKQLSLLALKLRFSQDSAILEIRERLELLVLVPRSPSTNASLCPAHRKCEQGDENDQWQETDSDDEPGVCIADEKRIH